MAVAVRLLFFEIFQREVSKEQGVYLSPNTLSTIVHNCLNNRLIDFKKVFSEDIKALVKGILSLAHR